MMPTLHHHDARAGPVLLRHCVPDHDAGRWPVPE